MGFLFGRKKVWQKNETVLSPDLNAEFNNVLNNASLPNLSGYSTTVAQMQQQVTPGSLGSESLAQTTADELTRLRFVISRIIGGTYWYDLPTNSLGTLSTILNAGSAIPTNRVVSGLTRTTSNQPAFLVPNGTNLNLVLKGSTTPLVYYIAGIQYTISTDITLALTAATASATALVNDTSLVGQASSFVQGEQASILTYDTASSAFISGATVGTFQAFQMNDGGSKEYFIGYVNSTTQITKCFRGFFFDSSTAPIKRIAVNDEDTINLLRLFWIFATTSGTVVSSTTNPKIALTQPTSPSSGDYWFDLSAKIWKTYNGTAFVAANATLLGVAISTSSDLTPASACVGAKAFEFYAPYDSTLTCSLEIQDNNTLRTSQEGLTVSVAGNRYNFYENIVTWVKPGNLDTGISDTASATYYAYLKDTGDVVLSNVIPYDRTSDLRGYYHPYNPWRALGSGTNDSSSHFSVVSSSVSVNPNDVANARTRSVAGIVGAGGVAISNSSGAFSTTNTTATNITNQSVIITTTGRPVFVGLQYDGTNGNVSSITANKTSANNVNEISVQLFILRGATVVLAQRLSFEQSNTSTSAFLSEIPSSSIWQIDTPAAGTYTYSAQALVSNASGEVDVNYVKLVAFEL